MEAPIPMPAQTPLKAYKFKRDYSFDADTFNTGQSPLWTAKEGDIVVGRPFIHPHVDSNVKGDWIGLIGGNKQGLIEADVLEEIPLTDEIKDANYIIDVGNFPIYKRPSWLRRKWNSIHELWYYIFKAKYHIVRRKVKFYDKPTGISGGQFVAGEIQEEMFLSLENDDNDRTNLVWSTSTNKAQVFMFLASILLIRTFKKNNKNSEHEFSLITVSDAKFVEDIVGKRPDQKTS